MENKNNVSTTFTMDDSTSPSLLQDITLDKSEVGMRASATSGLTMKEYEEQLKKLTAENFNLKLRVYFVEERLSKVTGISDKEDLIKKNIQLKVTCESQLKELEKKQELLFEASKAFELLQKEHAEEVEKLTKEKNKEILELEEKLSALESVQNEIKAKFPNANNLSDASLMIKSYEEYEKQISELEANLREEEDKAKEMEIMFKDNQLELASYQAKFQRMESELEQRINKVEELVEELEQKEHDLASSNFRIRKLEDEIRSKQREEEIMKERIEEKNKTIESLKSSLSTKDDSIEALENRLAKERSSSQTLQSKLDSVSYQNARLKEELEVLQSRLRRTTESLSPRGKGRPVEDDSYRQKYEELLRLVSEQESQYTKRVKEIEEKLQEKRAEAEDYHDLLEKHKKLEDDHRKACTVIKNFIKRSSEEKKEREMLNHLLNNHEEVIADLKARLNQYQSSSPVAKNSQEDKLSLAGSGDNDRKSEWTTVETCHQEKGYEDQMPSEKTADSSPELPEAKEEKMDSESEEIIIVELETEVERQKSEAEIPTPETETKKLESEKLNGELKRKNINLQELVNKELRDKNREIEILEKRLEETRELSRKEIEGLKMRVKELEVLEEKEAPKKFGGMVSGDWVMAEGVSEMKMWLKNNTEEKYKCAEEETIGKEAAEICMMLSVRLEELAVFLDSLLTNRSLLDGFGLKKYQDIKQTLEKSRELSKRLSLSLMNKKELSESTLEGNSFLENESLPAIMSKDKVISDQSVIINRLREQLRVLTQEIKQRDIELSHCQGEGFPDEEAFLASDQGIENQTLSMCQELSDFDVEEEEKEKEVKPEVRDVEVSGRQVLVGEKKSPRGASSQETSESEAWSEPDRSVSLARMGRLEDVTNTVGRVSAKCDDSSESSEETLNENPRASGKKCRNSESEIRRLQSRIKTLDETNEMLLLENNFLKTGKSDSVFPLRIQKNEEANLMEKLRKAMSRLEEYGITYRQLEDKLASALERASTSAMQLSRATETITVLEEEINNLKEEISKKDKDAEEKVKRIKELESRIEEITMESELKIIEAIKQKEAAERKTVEVECKLKEAENMSKEVETRVNEIEKKICETKKFKRDTVFHFKEAEKHVDTAEKMMEEAEKIKQDAERKSKDFQNFVDLMRKEVEEKMKEAERRVRKSEKEKEEMEKQVSKLRKKLLEAEMNKTEVEARVKEGKETIQCMEEKLKELEVAMDQCSEEAQKRIKEIQKKADSRVMELEMKIQERELVRKAEAEKKLTEVEKISKELELGFRRQLEDSEMKVKKTKEATESAIQKILEESKRHEMELKERILKMEVEKKEECSELRKQLDEAKVEASELELKLSKLTNEKIHLEEELKKILDKESALAKDNREIRGRYESSILELENKLAQLTLNKSHLASRLEEIESTNTELVSRISAIQRGKETMVVEHEVMSAAVSPPSSPVGGHGSFLTTLFADLDLFPAESRCFHRQGSAVSDPGDQVLGPHPAFAPRRNMNSSPDLGIESDPGRFSSLEANQQSHGDQITGNPEFSEVHKLEIENAELRRRLARTRQALQETLTQLSAANQRKKQVEKAICKQLHKTHHILKKARVNFESQDGDSVE